MESVVRVVTEVLTTTTTNNNNNNNNTMWCGSMVCGGMVEVFVCVCISLHVFVTV